MLKNQKKKIVSVKERVLFCNKCRRHGPFHNIGATVRAAAVNYTKHDNNNTITTITQRRKQRERKKKKRFCKRENKNGILYKNNPKIRDNITAAMITVKCRRRQWENSSAHTDNIILAFRRTGGGRRRVSNPSLTRKC